MENEAIIPPPIYRVSLNLVTSINIAIWVILLYEEIDLTLSTQRLVDGTIMSGYFRNAAADKLGSRMEVYLHHAVF